LRYSNRFLPGRRALAVAATGAMALSLVPGSALAGVEEVCADQTEDQFDDDDGTFWEDEINCIAGYDIVGGFPDGEYKPARDVTRAEMTRFMVNTYETATGETVTPSEDYFSDDDGHVLEEAINQAAEVGIVVGEASGDFNPGGLVSRAAMSAFVSNMVEAVQGSELDGGDTDAFTDDDASGFEETINKLAANDIVQGVSDTEYDPTPNVYRGEMAGFTLNAAGYLDDNGFWNPPAGANQTFTVTPGDDATITTGDVRQYEVTGIDSETVDIALFECDEVTVEDGVATFNDDENDGVGNNRADQGNVNATVEIVNGVSVNGDADEIAVTNGTVSFTVESNGAECFVPVVFNDADDDDFLDLNADDEPTEAFGVGGATTVLPEELGAFEDATGDVIDADTDADFYTLDENENESAADVLVEYATGDTFQYDNGLETNAISMAQFESFLTAGDNVTVENYNPGASTHTINTDEPNAPEGVAAEVGDFDDDTETAGADDIRITWDDATGGLVTGYNVDVYEVDTTDEDAEVCTDHTLLTAGADYTVFDEDADDNEIVAEDLGDGVYCVVVNAETATDASSANDGPQVEVAAATDEDGPIIESLDLVIDTDGDADAPAPDGIMNDGDRYRVQFDEAVVLDGAMFEFSDGEGDVGEVACDTNATCAVSSDGATLLVTLTDDPLLTDFSGDAAVNYPATLTDVAGIEDAAGNAIDIEDAHEDVILGDADVALANVSDPVNDGENITGDLTGNTAVIDTVAVSGACITDNANLDVTGDTFAIPSLNTADDGSADGDCELTFVTSFTDGSPDDTDTVTVTIVDDEFVV
jgi:hypothetical protein